MYVEAKKYCVFFGQSATYLMLIVHVFSDVYYYDEIVFDLYDLLELIGGACNLDGHLSSGITELRLSATIQISRLAAFQDVEENSLRDVLEF